MYEDEQDSDADIVEGRALLSECIAGSDEDEPAQQIISQPIWPQLAPSSPALGPSQLHFSPSSPTDSTGSLVEHFVPPGCQPQFTLPPPAPDNLRRYKPCRREVPAAAQDNYPLPTASCEQPAAQRAITFNPSVRIGGGLRGSSSRRASSRGRARVNSADVFAPINILRTPGVDGERRPSIEAIARKASREGAADGNATAAPHSVHAARSGSTSSLMVFGSFGGGYASSAASGAHSRSSSPASSIYAPLTAPSATCPTPYFNRPPSLLDRQQQARRQSFREFLKPGSGRDSSDSEDEEEEEPDSTKSNYKALLREQERRKAERTAARAHRRGLRLGAEANDEAAAEEGMASAGLLANLVSPKFWTRLLDVVASGAGGAGRRGGGVYGTTPAALRAGKKRSGSGDSSRSLGNGSEVDAPISSPVRSRPTINWRDHPHLASGVYATSAAHTEAFVRFGPPGMRRAKQVGWWRYKMGQGWRVVARAVGDGICCGVRKGKEREPLLRAEEGRAGYQSL